MITITLTPEELAIAALVGQQRQIANTAEGRMHKYGFRDTSGEGWAVNIEGAAAELAACKWAGVHWTALEGRRAPDIGGICDVRSTPYPEGVLFVHDDDPDDRPVLLVTGRTPTFTMRGWIMGRTAKRIGVREEKQPGRPAYCVPQTALLALEHLKRRLHERLAAPTLAAPALPPAPPLTANEIRWGVQVGRF